MCPNFLSDLRDGWSDGRMETQNLIVTLKPLEILLKEEKRVVN
jgi:hypothetical protein